MRKNIIKFSSMLLAVISLLHMNNPIFANDEAVSHSDIDRKFNENSLANSSEKNALILRNVPTNSNILDLDSTDMEKTGSFSKAQLEKLFKISEPLEKTADLDSSDEEKPESLSNVELKNLFKLSKPLEEPSSLADLTKVKEELDKAYLELKASELEHARLRARNAGLAASAIGN